MTLGAKILISAAVLCLLFWFALIGLGVQPLFADKRTDVVYGEGEEFFSDAAAYRKFRNDHFLILHLPRARSTYRWVSMDFEDMTITLTKSARSLGSFKFRLKNDEKGTILQESGPGGEWFWHFTDQGAAFSGNGFSCRVRRLQK